MDSAGLLAGDAWEARLLQAIRTSDFVVALLSEHTAGGYQDAELRIAANHPPRGRGADVPFIVPCVTGKLLRETDAAIPEFLDPDAVIRFWNSEANWRLLHKRLHTAAGSTGLTAPMLLRSKPRSDFDDAAASEMIIRRNFFDSTRNATGRPAASRLTTLWNGALVEDAATGRVWTRNCGAPVPYTGQPLAWSRRTPTRHALVVRLVGDCRRSKKRCR
jgi:hypothetical protein